MDGWTHMDGWTQQRNRLEITDKLIEFVGEIKVDQQMTRLLQKPTDRTKK